MFMKMWGGGGAKSICRTKKRVHGLKTRSKRMNDEGKLL
jgi:hypothetical protein